MSTFGWVAAGYVLVGLLIAAFWWHVNTSEEAMERAAKELPQLRGQAAGGLIYYSASLLMTALVTLLWPLVVGWVTVKRLKDPS